MINLSRVEGFDWDSGNARKNEKHGVTMAEIEQVFFNASLLLLDDLAHSTSEGRFHALGKTDESRLLHVTFTLRADATLVRPISARDMHKRERAIYANQST